jgi:hypothetical protein
MATESELDLQEDHGFKFLLTSRLTQDYVENLFSMVRLKNPVPTPLPSKTF